MRYLDIAAVAQQSGVPASALRYYEEKGLIASVGRRGLRRLFDARVLERLALIALGQAAGFSLDEIAGMFTVDGRPKIDRKTLATKADGTGPDDPAVEFDAGRATPRCGLPRAESHGMPIVPPPDAGSGGSAGRRP